MKLAAPVGGLVAGMLFHGLHNLGASLAAANCLAICLGFIFDWGGILMLGLLITLVWGQEKNWMAEQLPGKVGDRCTDSSLPGSTGGARAGKPCCTPELAFKKHRLAYRDQDPKVQKDVERYR